MMKRFKVGDLVTWNSEAGHVSGTIIKVHTKNVSYKGYTHHANADDPQYEIKSAKTDHIAMHKGQALTKKEHLKGWLSHSRGANGKENRSGKHQTQARL